MKITLAQLAAQIEKEFPDLTAVAEPGRGFCNTDRKIGRLRHPGKGRVGTLLTVRRKLPVACTNGQPHRFTMGPHCNECGEHRDGIVYQHNAAETYRRNQDVMDWIRAERNRRAAS